MPSRKWQERNEAADHKGGSRKGCSWLVLILVNALVLVALLATLNLGSALLLSRVILAKPPLAGGPESPAFAGDEKRMRTFFREYGQLTMVYRDYVGWRREPFQGETINIRFDGARVVGRTAASDDAPQAFFFGGSTMWGTGAVDEETIPGHFAAAHPRMQVHNQGETAYVARQSLAALVNFLAAGARPKLVVFYDGVNDVGTLCRREITLPGQIRQDQFERALEGGSGFSEAVRALDTLFIAYTDRLVLQVTGDDRVFDCSTDPAKAEQVAEHVVQVWTVAHELVTALGGRFVGVLQPSAYVGAPTIDHIADDLAARDSLADEFGAVYPLIAERIRDIPYLYDMSNAFDGDQIFYADWAHVNGAANAVIAGRISAIIEGEAPVMRTEEP